MFAEKYLALKWFGLGAFFLLGFVIFYSYAVRFLDWLRFQSVGTRDYIVEKLAMMFIDIPAHQVLLGLFGLSIGLGGFAFVAFLPQLLPACVFGAAGVIAGWKLPKPVVDWWYRKRVNTFVLQMVDGLNLVANGMKSGLSVVQALDLVTQEMNDPIRQEFRYVLNQNKLGTSLEDALNDMAKRIKSDDVEMFVTSVNILKETGGNLAETFDTIVHTIRERIKVEKKIEALTAQGFYQGLAVMSVAPLMLIMMQQSDPEFMSPMFTSPIGWGILFVAMLLEVAGFLVIMKIVKIDV
jgi:tight adherence protein B